MITRAIVLNYNAADCTLRCVHSLLIQLVQPSHIVVVDNHSELVDFRQLQLNLPPTVTLLRTGQNLGYAAGNNQAIGTITGLPTPEAYLIVNNDVRFEQPDTIARLENALRTNPTAVAISPLVHTLSNTLPVRSQIQVRRLVKPGWVMLFHSPLLHSIPGIYSRYKQFIYFDLVPYQPRIYEVDTINGACFLIYSAFLDKNGGFDEHTFLYLEELVLGEQIRRAGLQCLLHGGVVIRHEQGVASKYLTTRERFTHFLRSEAYLLSHYYGIAAILLHLLRIQRWMEFWLKNLYRKIIKHPHLVNS